MYMQCAQFGLPKF